MAVAMLLVAAILLTPAACAPTTTNGDDNTTNGDNVGDNVSEELPPADPSLVTFNWSPPLPEYAARARYTATLEVSSPRSVTSVMLDGEEVGTPGEREFRLPITFDLAAGADHTVTIDVEAAPDDEELPSPFAETSVSIALDDEAPSVTLMGPAWPEDEVPTVTASLAEVALRVSDNVRVERLMAAGTEVDVEGGEGELDTMTTITLAQGRQTLAFEATDPAGNTTRIERTIFVDSLPPSIELTSPVTGLTAFRVDDDVVQLRGQVRDPSGVESLEVNGGTVQLRGPEHERSFDVEVELQEGTNRVECMLADKLGNVGMVVLTIISGALTATEPTPEGLEVPLPPDDEFGVRTADASADGEDPETAMHNLQRASMARLLAETWNVRADLVNGSEALREFARSQHVEFDGWQQTESGWFVAGRIVVAEDDLLRVVSENAADLTPPDRRPAPLERLFTHPINGTLDAVGATTDLTSVVLVTRDQGRVSIHRLFNGQLFGRLDSALTWDRVTTCRLVDRGKLVLIAGEHDGERQFELFRETPEPLLPAPVGGVAFHPAEPRVACKTGTSVDLLTLPEMTSETKLTLADPDVRLIGYSPDGEALLALGATTDEFGIRLPGTLLVIDPQSGETLDAWHRLDAALGSRDLVSPSLDDSDLDDVIEQLDRAVGAVMSSDGSALLLTLPDAALPLDPRTGAIIGPSFPEPRVAEMLGAPLAFEPSANGDVVVVRGADASILLEPDRGRQLARLSGGRIVLSSVGNLLVVQREGTCTAISLDAVMRRVTSPRVTPDVVAGVGDRLRLHVRARLGDELDELIDAHGRVPLTGWLRANGYDLAAPGDEDDNSAVLRVETWQRDDMVRVRVTLAAGEQTPSRLLLGTTRVTRAEDETDDEMFARLFRELRPQLAPVPSRICEMADAAHDLPLDLGGN